MAVVLGARGGRSDLSWCPEALGDTVLPTLCLQGLAGGVEARRPVMPLPGLLGLGTPPDPQ